LANHLYDHSSENETDEPLHGPVKTRMKMFRVPSIDLAIKIIECCNVWYICPKERKIRTKLSTSKVEKMVEIPYA